MRNAAWLGHNPERIPNQLKLMKLLTTFASFLVESPVNGTSASTFAGIVELLSGS